MAGDARQDNQILSTDLPISRAYEAFKRVFDFILAFIGLIVLSPLLVMIAVAIKLTSSGPIFYRGVRTGRHGKFFRMMKFRTMVANAESVGGTSTAETDPRITRIGKWLRAHKLDEFPQLFNVLKGEMSLVGPRPEVEEYTRLYTPEEMAILEVPPGITDFSSIKFRDLNAILAEADDPDKYFAENVLPTKNKLRLEYVRNRSLWLDFKIIFLTLRAIWQ
ncbi:MAG TPA: sugar transferase [Terriglobia bacterium]|nr:sugar transferase [Terriglobia bacterium]